MQLVIGLWVYILRDNHAMATGHRLFTVNEQELTLALEHELRTRGVIVHDGDDVEDDVDVGNRFVVV